MASTRAQTAGVNGTAVFVVTVGAVVLISGLTNKKISAVVLGFLQGTAPVPETVSDGSVDASGVPTYTGEHSGGVPILTGTTTQKQIANALKKDLGLSRAGNAAVLANIQAESNFSTSVIGDKGTSIGLAQWHAERWDNLKAYARSVGGKETDLAVQIGFLEKELRSYPDLLNTLRTTTNASDAAADFDHTFERSTGTTTDTRRGYAQRFLLLLQAWRI